MGEHVNRQIFNLKYSFSHLQLNVLPLSVSLSLTLALSAGRPEFEDAMYWLSLGRIGLSSRIRN
jgi:hypothetical protein